MKYLSDYPVEQPQRIKHGKYRGAIVDKKTAQRLEFSSDEPFVALTLHDSIEWGQGKRPDGVLVAVVDGVTWICFIEMKGKPDDSKAFLQLKNAAEHFAPEGRIGNARAHGDDHHDQWAQKEDDIGIWPTAEHRILGLFVSFRQVTRVPPVPPALIAGKPFLMKMVQVMKQHPNWAGVTPRELLLKAGIDLNE